MKERMEGEKYLRRNGSAGGEVMCKGSCSFQLTVRGHNDRIDEPQDEEPTNQ